MVQVTTTSWSSHRLYLILKKRISFVKRTQNEKRKRMIIVMIILRHVADSRKERKRFLNSFSRRSKPLSKRGVRARFSFELHSTVFFKRNEACFQQNREMVKENEPSLWFLVVEIFYTMYAFFLLLLLCERD